MNTLEFGEISLYVIGALIQSITLAVCYMTYWDPYTCRVMQDRVAVREKESDAMLESSLLHQRDQQLQLTEGKATISINGHD